MKNLVNSITVFSIISFLFLGGCGTTKFSVPIKRPAEINLSKFNKIAIGEITGPGSADLSEALTTALFNSKSFEVLDRQHLDQLLKELNLNVSGLVNEESASKVGELIGSSALIFGRVSKYDYSEQIFEDKWQDKKGYNHIDYTREGIAIMDVNLQVTDLTTGKIIAIKKFSVENKGKEISRDEKPPYINKDRLLIKSREDVVNNFMRVIAPYTEYVKVTFLDDSDVPEFEQAIRRIKIGEWFAAQSLYNEAVNKYPTNSKAHYNLGVVFEYNGVFDKAEQHLKKAYTLEEDKLYLEELKNSKRMKADRNKLQEQLY